MSFPTPIFPSRFMGKQLDVSLFFKRDDLFPFVGGGNKARKIGYILHDAESHNANALITTGGVQSNHARVVALAAAQKGWHSFLVLHGPSMSELPLTGNHLLMHLAGAEIHIVAPEQIHETMAEISARCLYEGLSPYVIEGGGHSIFGTLAYYDAIPELIQQCDAINWFPDWIVLASGTGTTQAGIVVGCQQNKLRTKVVGISVARKNPRGRDVLSAAYREFCLKQSIPPYEGLLDFRDAWVGDGYERADEKVLQTIKDVCRKEGLVLDPTYTGKAFCAMVDMIRSNVIPKGSNVLFWHTGGLLNLLAADAYIKQMK